MSLVKKIVCVFISIILLINCRRQNLIDLAVESEKILDSIPSGSGILVNKDTVYIISDDGTGIYQLNLNNNDQNKIQITGLPFSEYREPKSNKHDFEGASFITWGEKKYLVAVGSGSDAGARDSLLLLNPSYKADQKIISVHNFYKELQSLTKTDGKHWNIEGLATVNDRLVFLNRGNNMIINCLSNEFFSFLLEPHAPFPKVNFHKVKLPNIDKHEARLSGATILDDDNLLICASVEDTPDWISDGPVLGSYIGIYSMKEKRIKIAHLLKNAQGEVVKEKIESVDLLEKPSNNEIRFLAIADNDNGSSKLFYLRMRY